MSYARPNNPIIGDERVQRVIQRQKARGKDQPDISQFLAKQLAAGRGLSSQVANKYSAGKYPTGDPSTGLGTFYGGDDEFDKRFGKGSAANLRGLADVELGKGDVFMGATKVSTPGTSTTNHQSGHTSTPGTTRYDLTVLPRWMVQQGGDSSGSAGLADQPRQPTDDRGLQAAREAVSRAGQYKETSAGSAAGGSAAGGTGSSENLFENIAALGQGQIDDYERRFIPAMQAKANLGIQEVGYGIRGMIDSLPSDLAVPDYLDPFSRGSYRRGNKKSLFDFLKGQIA